MKRSEINLRDPFVLTENQKLYLYGTAGKNSWCGRSCGFNVYVSEDGENFTEKKIFEPSQNFWADENFWAPEVHKIRNKYYMFASFYKQGLKRRSQILVCDTPDGTFCPIGEPLTPKEWDCLDATYFEEDGKKYTVFCHEWTQCDDGEMILAELDDDLQIKGGVKKLFNASDAPWVKDIENGKFITDGPFIRRMNCGRLIMLWSSNGKTGYAMGMAVADRIGGPWKHIAEPLISSDGGHGMIFEKDGKLFLTYHMPNHPSGAERPYFVEIAEENGRYVLKNQ